ncbi:MAG: cache domain-containing protein [Methanoregula sp.]|nr:cache domain-containing protein [Methanoregula sp.]
MTLNLRSFILMGILIIALLICAGCSQGQAPTLAQTPVLPATVTPGEPASPTVTTTVYQAATKEEMVAFVKEAITFARLNGKEKALAEFSNPKGSFFRGELYIYAYDYNGTTIAHPVNPEKIGVNRFNEKDAEGKLFIQDLRQTAYNGTGFSTYDYINPVDNNTVERKLSYAMSVDNTWWLGSGIYRGPADTAIKP